MKVITRSVISIETGEVLEEQSYEYEGPVALCEGGDGGGDGGDVGIPDADEMASWGEPDFGGEADLPVPAGDSLIGFTAGGDIVEDGWDWSGEGAKAGAAAGSILGPVGTVVGGFLGGALPGAPGPGVDTTEMAAEGSVGGHEEFGDEPTEVFGSKPITAPKTAPDILGPDTEEGEDIDVEEVAEKGKKTSRALRRKARARKGRLAARITDPRNIGAPFLFIPTLKA